MFNAGITLVKPVSQMTAKDLETVRIMTETNYLSVLTATTHALPYLKLSPTHGRIAVVSSTAGLVGAESMAAYSGTKFALQGFFSALRLEEPALTITMVYPEYVETDMWGKEWNDERICDKIKQSQPTMEVDEAAKRIVFGVKMGMRNEVLSLRGLLMWYLRDLAPYAMEKLNVLAE